MLTLLREHVTCSQTLIFENILFFSDYQLALHGLISLDILNILISYVLTPERGTNKGIRKEYHALQKCKEKKREKKKKNGVRLHMENYSRSIYSHNIKESASFASMLNSFTCKMSIYLQTDFSFFPLSLDLAIPASCYGHILLAHRSMASHGSLIIHISRTGLMELVLYVERKKTKKLPQLLSLSETVSHYSMVNTYIINWTRFANSDSRST